jgi:hypothetical protein
VPTRAQLQRPSRPRGAMTFASGPRSRAHSSTSVAASQGGTLANTSLGSSRNHPHE